MANMSDVLRALEERSKRAWSLRILGTAHLCVLCFWWFLDQRLLGPDGYFEARYNSSWVWSALWGMGGVGLILMHVRWTWLTLLCALTGAWWTLNASPEVLLLTSDKLLLSLTILMLGLSLQSTLRVTRLSFALFTAAWLWPSAFIFFESSELTWRWGRMISFWGWTDASPTPLAPLFAHSAGALRLIMGILTFSLLAWGPLLCLSRTRLWPVVWGVIAPLALWVGDGYPSWYGTVVWICALILLDERFPWQVTQAMNRGFEVTRAQTHHLLSIPLGLVSIWLCFTVNSGVMPLLILSAWLFWSDDVRVTLHPSRSFAAILRLVALCGSVLIAISIALIIPLRLKDDLPQQSRQSLEMWLVKNEQFQWITPPFQRTRLLFEVSEDGGASWSDQTPPRFALVQTDQLPWRPLSSERERRWFHSLPYAEDCVDGPLMDLIEDELISHINRLNSPPWFTNPENVLLRVRREDWVRSRYQFWRKEGRGFFCIPTNLRVLRIARAKIKQAQSTRPAMPKLANPK